MLKNTTPIVVKQIYGFISDEIHIYGKVSRSPKAILSFVSSDEFGGVSDNPVIFTMELSGDSFKFFYENWNSEESFYSSVKTLILSDFDNVRINGVDKSMLKTLFVSDSGEIV